MESVAVTMRIDGTTHHGRLVAWGRANAVWWGLVIWKQNVLNGSIQGEMSCAAWLPASTIRKHAGASADVVRISLPDDHRAWPAPFAWWTGWYAGAYLSGPLALPPFAQPDDRAEWLRRRDRGESRERKGRR